MATNTDGGAVTFVMPSSVITRSGLADEEIRPDDVARLEPGGLRRELQARCGSVARRGRRLERLLEPLHAVHTQPQRFDCVLVRRRQRAGRVDASRALDALLLLGDQAGELLLQRCLLETRSRQQRGQLLADARRGGADVADLGHVVVVGLALLVARAALHPHDEQDDDDDRERDQPDETQQRRQPMRRAQPRAARRPRRTRTVIAAARAVAGTHRRSLPGVVVDEVEVEDVVVVN